MFSSASEYSMIIIHNLPTSVWLEISGEAFQVVLYICIFFNELSFKICDALQFINNMQDFSKLVEFLPFYFGDLVKSFLNLI